MNNKQTDFKASISITAPSPVSKRLQESLPSDYTLSQTSNVYAFMYGTGHEIENLKETIGQSEANNYIYSPSVQEGQFDITGPGKYTVQFDIPYVVPPLNVSVSSSARTDAYLEFTSRFGMTINVSNGGSDVISWRASGAVGAATSEFLGDALYKNFGTIYNLPRVTDAVVDESFVSQYSNVTNFITVQQMIPVQDFTAQLANPSIAVTNPIPLNAPPKTNNNTLLVGTLRPTIVVTRPSASHELVDRNGKVIALMNFNGSIFPLTSTTSDLVTGFIGSTLRARVCPVDSVTMPPPAQNLISQDNGAYSSFEVYVVGASVAFTFNKWSQPSFVQETFRADNKYRRLLSGVASSLAIGPNVKGIANLMQAILAQPNIPVEFWEQSDYRVFNTSTPPLTQFDGTHGDNPVVEIREVTSDWTPETLTYASKPISKSITDIAPVTITQLNSPTSFDLTSEVIRQLRVGIDAPEGGIFAWNYLQNSLNVETLNAQGQLQVAPQYTNGVVYNGQTYPYNYVFLNNANDSISNLTIFYYQTQFVTEQSGRKAPTQYQGFGPLIFNRDYFIVEVASLYNADLDAYDLPSELLIDYNCNSTLPFVANLGSYTAGSRYMGKDQGRKQLPTAILRIDLSASGYASTKLPTNTTDFLIYSYANLSVSSGFISGSFNSDPIDPTLTAYYDSRSAQTVQPSDSTFLSSNVQLAQGSYARLTSETGFEFATTMIAGQIQFNKTITVDNLIHHTPNPNYGATGIPVLQISQATLAVSNTQTMSSTGAFFTIPGRIVKNTFEGNPYFQIENAEFIIIDQYNFPIGIVDASSSFAAGNLQVTIHDLQQSPLPLLYQFSGVVGSIVWDTRIPVTDYQDTAPIFQASNNFDADMVSFTPDINVPTVALPINTNFMALIRAVPLGNQQTVTATWTFGIIQQKSQRLTGALNNVPIIAFPDLAAIKDAVTGAVIQPVLPGIMSYFTGKVLLRQFGSDPDSAQYVQQYISPAFTAYFIGYKDYIYSNYGGTNGFSKLSAGGDSGNFDTIFNSQTTPANKATLLTFFSPQAGIFTTSIVPGMSFYDARSGSPVNITRPRNKGIALRIKGDSYAGLVFYGQSLDQTVDKPSRVLLDFTFSASQSSTRHRVLEIESNTFAGWVDGMRPGQAVSDGSIFYLAGNQFKYSADGQDQAINAFGPAVDNNGNLVNNGLLVGQQYSLPSVVDAHNAANPTSKWGSAAYEYAPSDVQTTPGGVMRYRRPEEYSIDSSGNEIRSTTYVNKTPEKIAYFKFNLDALPIDTLLAKAILEIHFCSGFTIRQGNDKNLTLSYNKLWKKSRLSGNGSTQNVVLRDTSGRPLRDASNNQLPPVTRSLNNVHWRKNFFEIVVPYAFKSNFKPNLANIFNPSKVTLFGEQVPQSGIEYLGFANLDEIGVKQVPVSPNVYIEDTQGLTSLLMSKNAIIWQVVAGTLTADSTGRTNIMPYSPSNVYDGQSELIAGPLGLPTQLQFDTYNLPVGFRHYRVINQSDVLPNMKVIIFPFGITNPTLPQDDEFVYGFVKSVLASSEIGFDANNVSLYKQLLGYIVPLYAEYDVKLLESDTYFPFLTFGRGTSLDGTPADISY